MGVLIGGDYIAGDWVDAAVDANIALTRHRLCARGVVIIQSTFRCAAILLHSKWLARRGIRGQDYRSQAARYVARGPSRRARVNEAFLRGGRRRRRRQDDVAIRILNGNARGCLDVVGLLEGCVDEVRCRRRLLDDVQRHQTPDGVTIAGSVRAGGRLFVEAHGLGVEAPGRQFGRVERPPASLDLDGAKRRLTMVKLPAGGLV